MGQVLLAIAVLLGFLITAASVWVPHSAARIQNQLHEQARERLIAAELSFVAVSIDGRDVVLSGLAPDAAARQRALSLVAEIEGLGAIDSQIELTERFVLQANLADSQLCLRGVLPSAALKRELLALSPLPCTREPDALGVDETASGWIWPALVLAEVIKLNRAELELTEQRARIRGETANAKQQKLIDSALRGVIPAGIEVEIQIEVPTANGEGP